MSSVIGALRFDLGLNTAAFDSGLNKADGKAKSFAGGIVKALAPIAAAFAAAFSVRAISRSVDAWSDMNARLRNATGSAEAGAAAMDRLQVVARRSYSSIEQTTEAFLRQSTTLTALGVGTAKQLDLTEALNNALVISATRGQRAQSVMDAWGKAMATGALRGQNLNTVISGSDRLAQALADSMGINVAELQRYGAEGKITREVMLGITDQLEVLREEAEAMPATLEDGMGIISDAMLQLVGRIDQAMGASEGFAGVLVDIGDAITSMTPYLVSLARIVSDVLGRAFDLLGANIGVLLDVASIAGAALLGFFAGPALIGGITAATVAIVTGFVPALNAVTVAIRGVTAAMMANPLGMIIAAAAAAVTAIFVFRDTIRDVFGIDVVDMAKGAANALIASFDLAFRNIQSVWGALPQVLGSIAISTANNVIGAIENMVNGAIDLINDLIALANHLPGLDIQAMDPVAFSGFDDPHADALGMLRLEMDLNRYIVQQIDYVGALGAAFSELGADADAAAEQFSELNETLEGTGAAGGKAGQELANALEALRQALMTEEEAELASFEKRIAQIQDFYDRGMILKDEYDQMMERAHQLHSDRMSEITRKQVEEEARIRSALVGHASSIFGSLSTIMENFGEENLATSKAFAVAAAIINTAEGITKALAQGGLLGFAGAASVAAAGMAQISTIMSAGKGSGVRPSVGAAMPAPVNGNQRESEAQPDRMDVHLHGLDRSALYSGESVERLIELIEERSGDGRILNFKVA